MSPQAKQHQKETRESRERKERQITIFAGRGKHVFMFGCKGQEDAPAAHCV